MKIGNTKQMIIHIPIVWHSNTGLYPFCIFFLFSAEILGHTFCGIGDDNWIINSFWPSQQGMGDFDLLARKAPVPRSKADRAALNRNVISRGLQVNCRRPSGHSTAQPPPCHVEPRIHDVAQHHC